jgi:small subunit ribosomal protein S6
VSEPVIKFITVRVDESQKRAEKIQKLRASKVKRSTAEAAAAAMPPAEAPAAEAAPEATA